jgi:hypothetical protein
MLSLQVKLTWLDGTRSRLQSYVERGGNLESEHAITLRSVFLHAFVELALELGGESFLSDLPGLGEVALPTLDAEYPVAP